MLRFTVKFRWDFFDLINQDAGGRRCWLPRAVAGASSVRQDIRKKKKTNEKITSRDSRDAALLLEYTVGKSMKFVIDVPEV